MQGLARRLKCWQDSITLMKIQDVLTVVIA